VVQRMGIDDAERAFREWRRGKVSGAAIPESLWERAADVARVHGVAATARRLHLNQTRMKHRCEARSDAGFVEIAASELPPVGESIVELEDAAGNRLRLVLRGAPIAAVTAAAKELWGVTH
jgi:hypothetical protein